MSRQHEKKLICYPIVTRNFQSDQTLFFCHGTHHNITATAYESLWTRNVVTALHYVITHLVLLNCLSRIRKIKTIIKNVRIFHLFIYTVRRRLSKNNSLKRSYYIYRNIRENTEEGREGVREKVEIL